MRNQGQVGMSTVLEFALLGLVTGALYALFALGIVVIHRGSGVVNFAQGAVGMAGTFIFWELDQNHLPYLMAAAIGIFASGVIGLLIHITIMRPLRRASLVIKIIATLGVLTAIQQTAAKLYTGPAIVVPSALPTRPVKILGTSIGLNYIIIFIGAVVVVVAAELVYQRTQFGRATSAAAENPRNLAALGWSPSRVAGINWFVGSALAGLAGIVLAPITNLSVTGFTLLVVPALAAAVVGRFNSVLLAFIGALIIGVAESEIDRYISTPGWSSVVPFALMILILVVRGSDRTLRVSPRTSLPSLGSGKINLKLILPLLALTLVVLPFLSANWQDAVITTAGTALIVLSVVVVTGYTGQLSLAQLAFAGWGAWVAGDLASSFGISFVLAIIIGGIAALPLGIVVGVVCLRTRGVDLAIATLGLAVALDSLVFSSDTFTQYGSFTVPEPRIGPLDVGAIVHPDRYGALLILVFAVCAVAIANLRRGRSGRRLVAVRSNERAAASLGIGVAQAKLFAFVLSSGIAAVGGALLAFSNPVILFNNYDPSTSIQYVGFAIVGGVGWIAGAVYGGLLAVGSLGNQLLMLLGPTVSSYLPLAGGVLVPVILVTAPDGLAAQGKRQLELLGSAFRRFVPAAPHADEPMDIPEGIVQAREPRTLELTDVEVRFGGVTAVAAVSLTVEPGEIVGLIGPNGAGKTSLIDAATGSVPLAGGSVKVGGKDLTRLRTSARTHAGLTRSFQSLELFDDLTVLDNLRTAADPRDFRAYISDLFWPRTAPLTAVTLAAIREFNLGPYLHKKPSDLTYGVRRLVGIARALATGASVIALDEPAAGLDEDEVTELGHLLRRLATDWKMGLLLVEHNVGLVMGLCDRIYVLNFGKVIAEGPPSAILQDEQVITAYLGLEASPADGTHGTSVS
jgi:ABC-type branched-subunit amino acid transport system ATPase component/branched-subunit amino acid ABC-type transport system permease component